MNTHSARDAGLEPWPYSEHLYNAHIPDGKSPRLAPSATPTRLRAINWAYRGDEKVRKLC